MAPNSYIIVGSGVFGASTALHLIRKYPTALITLVDRDAPDAATRVAASWDWNKVIRADYRSAFYAKLALEAQHLWRTDTVWQPFYHETGIVWISPTTFGEQAFRNFVELGADVDMKLYPVKEARAMYGGIFDDADYSGVKEVLVNRSSGWAEAKEALQSTIEAAVGLGVKYVMAEVAVLEFEECDGRRRCCGVRTAQGERIVGENVVLSTGAFTAKLLVDSAPAWVDLHAGDRMVATAATEAIAPLKTDQASMLRNMPVGINDNPTERGQRICPGFSAGYIN
jgi:glycine/D-amino acid oxidase-like deaminating enzyme